MEDAVYHAMKDRRKQLERSSESRHSAHNTHACTAGPDVQYSTC